MNRNRPEILAPAGSFETLTAAIRAGADAVYVGGKHFSARSNATNFTLDELSEAADFCHLRGVKIYLAVNTVISDDEACEFCRYIKETARFGIDAYIVQDWGCAYLIKKCVPDAVLHASTQMTVHTPYGAELLKELGFTRTVPARELDADTIKAICDTGIETEIFVHGALCMSVSGQCYMSAMIGSRSANRGRCGQACRLPFSACGNGNHAALSLKDLSLLPIISKAEATGSCSFKIEGRMKRPEYAASAVAALKTAMDGENPDMDTLKKIFSRGGFTNGYFTGNLSGMFGVREKEDVTAAKDIFPKIHELYRFERKCRTIDFHAVIKKNQPFELTASSGDVTVSAKSDIPETAVNRPTDFGLLEKQLSRLGDTIYRPGRITADIDGGLIVPAGKINDLRRRIVSELDGKIIDCERPKFTVTDYSPQIRYTRENNGGIVPVRVSCRTVEQALAVHDLAEFLIIPSDIAADERLSILDRDKIIISPPRFFTDFRKGFAQLETLKNSGFTRLLCHNPDCIELGKQLGFILHGGFGLNILNSFSIKVLARLGLTDVTASFEADISLLNGLKSEIPTGAVISGRLPLMLTRNCPIKNEIGCGKCTKQLTDRTGRSFMVQCSDGYVEILNSDVLFMADRLTKLRNISFGIVMLSYESPEQARRLIIGEKPPCTVTRGLYYRGIGNNET